MITDLYDPAYYRQSKPEPPAWPETDPVPEVLSIDPIPAAAPTMPRAVTRLQLAAEAAGWVVRVGFSSSPERAVRVGTYKQTEAYGVWAGAHPATGWRFNAIHTRTVGGKWAWRSTAIWKLGVPRFRHATVTDLGEFITVHGDVGKPWFKAVHARVEEQKVRQQQAARSRRGAPREGSS